MDTVRISFLGTGCGRPTAARFNSSTAVEARGQLILLDCGAPCTALLKKQGLSPGDVTHIVISHVHSDHVTGLPMLLREIRKARKNNESELAAADGVDLFVPGYANPEIMDAVAFFSGQNRSAFKETRLHSLYDKGQYDQKGFTLSSYKNRNDDLESYGFLLETAGHRLFYTGDLPGHYDLLQPYFQDLDLLITEAAHLKPAAYSTLDRDDLRQIIITHIRWKYHGREEELAAELSRFLPREKFLLAEEGMRVSLPL